jgi:hypothetical protein
MLVNFIGRLFMGQAPDRQATLRVDALTNIRRHKNNTVINLEGKHAVRTSINILMLICISVIFHKLIGSEVPM